MAEVRSPGFSGFPPLSLYVHLPWCVQKCPYCDFNSHGLKGGEPLQDYARLLLRDLEQDLPLVWGRAVHSVFFGGGTPSLFGADLIAEILAGLRALVTLSPDAEITLEANPGTAERGSFAAYRDAGINRVSLGAQSFDDEVLKQIGRIHGSAEIYSAVEDLHAAGMDNFNLDLMFALPGQDLAMAVVDVRQALSCRPTHLSHYQLTLEPNTAFHAAPPELPDVDLAWSMQQQSADQLTAAGFEHYEVSAWAAPGKTCFHNENYWRFGDYVGIGAGAHGKLTLPAEQAVERTCRERSPKRWMEAADQGNAVAERKRLNPQDLLFEYFLNRLRLRKPVLVSEFEQFTGLAWMSAAQPVAEAVDKGLLRRVEGGVEMTATGWRFVNEIQALFLP